MPNCLSVLLQISNSFITIVDCNKLLLGWFHSLLAAFLSMYPMALAFRKSWGLQGLLFQCLGSTHDLLGSSKGLASLLSLALLSAALYALVDSTPLLLLILVIIPWYWHLQYAVVFPCS